MLASSSLPVSSLADLNTSHIFGSGQEALSKKTPSNTETKPLSAKPGILNTISSIKTTLQQKAADAANKIAQIAKEIFAFIKALFLFPLRYFGSKTWSIPGLLYRAASGKPISFKEKGYHFEYENLNSPIESLPYASMTHYAHKTEAEWIAPFGYKPVHPTKLNIQDAEVESRELCFFNPQTGLKAILAEKEKEIAVIFGALSSSTHELKNNPIQNAKIQKSLQAASVFNIAGTVPAIYQEAFSFSAKLLDHPYFQNKQITFVGSSFGGSLASFVALKFQRPAVCINGLQLGAGLQQEIGDKTLKKADKYITHIFMNNDYLNDPPLLNTIDKIFSRAGIRTPGNFGKRYKISTPYQSYKQIHSFIFGSFIHNLGFDKKTLPKELPKEFLKRFQVFEAS